MSVDILTRQSFRDLRVDVTDPRLYTGAMEGMDVVCETTVGELGDGKYDWSISLKNKARYNFFNVTYNAVADTFSKMRVKMDDIVCACVGEATPKARSRTIPKEIWGER